MVAGKRKVSEPSASNGSIAHISKSTPSHIHKKSKVSSVKDSSQSKITEEGSQSESSDSEPDEKLQGKSISTASQDIHIARETAELFKSNIFKLQIDELLQQVKLKDTHILKLEKFLHRLYDLIQQVPDWEPKTLQEVENYFENKYVKVPFVDPKPSATNTRYKFNYSKPDVSLISSFALKTGIYQPSGASVDVLLTMPKELLENKDFLNFRCLHKRSVYLAYFTHHLSILIKKCHLDSFISLEYSYFNNDPLLPILKIHCDKTPTDSQLSQDFNFQKSKFSINLIVGFPYQCFDPKKLLPNKNCIRITKDDDQKDVLKFSTPYYNFAVLSSTTYEQYLKFLHKTKKLTDSFKEASILGRIWLQQRGFSSNLAHSGSLGGFGTFEFSILMAALLNGGGENGNKILLHGFSSYQLFKGIIKYIATMDLCDSGHLQFHSDYSSNISSKYVDEGFETPTMFDKTTKVNILSKMTVNSYNILKAYASETLRMLNNVVQDQFSNIFLTNLNKIDNIKYDTVYDIHLPQTEDMDTHLINSFETEARMKFVTFQNFLINRIQSVVKYSLGDRIKLTEVEVVGQKHSFPISKRKAYASGLGKLSFTSIRLKFLMKTTEAEKLVTKGPPHVEPITEEASIFKNFWGPKASLRRFKDGSITHCCIWSSSSSEPIISEILQFAIKRHISEKAEIKSLGTKLLQDMLPLPNLPSSSNTSIVNLGSFYSLKQSFDELYKKIFKMELPLAVKSILPIGSAFRYTSLCQPVPFAYSNPDFFQDVIIEFETSPKWPDELVSLEKSKAAFLLKIRAQLDEMYGESYKSFFTRDESVPYNLEIITLNILTPEGFGFKVRVLTERDEVLYLRAVSNARNELKPELEKTFLKFTSKYISSIRHTRSIESISHHYQLYSPTVRLFKKWLDVHLLLEHFPEELVELIAIKPFVEHSPFFVPGSLVNGFLKVLRFLSQWNWKDEPLILDLVKPEEHVDDSNVSSSDPAHTLDKKFTDKLTLAQYKGIQGNFLKLRKTDPNGLHLQFFVASRNEPSGILYSSDIPLPIAVRLTALAKIAINLVQSHGMNKQTIDLLFTPALMDYDFTVHLKTPTPLKISSGVIEQGDYRNLINKQAPVSFPTDLNKLSEKMDPTYQLVKYLNLKYKNSILFSSRKFTGVVGGENGDENVITGLIKPYFKKPEKFRVNMDGNVKPLDEEVVELNKDAIFHEIASFSNDLVVKFECSNSS